LETNDKGQPLSLNTFLYQEVDRFNALTAYMRNSLDTLIRAIDGTVVMSLDLEIMGNSFQDNKMPPRW
jgi:dynein heavy chain